MKMSKNTAVAIFSVIILIGFAGFVAAQDDTTKGQAEPSNVAQRCPGTEGSDCSYDSNSNTVTVNSGKNPDLAGFDGTVNLNGNSFTYEGGTISGTGSCTLSGGRAVCQLNPGSTIGGIAASGNLDISSDGTVTLTGDGSNYGHVSAVGDSTIVCTSSTNCDVTDGFGVFDGDYTGTLTTGCPSVPIGSASAECGWRTPEGHSLHSENQITVNGPGDYTLGPHSSFLNNPVTPTYWFGTGATGLYDLHLTTPCTAGPNNCISIIDADHTIDFYITDSGNIGVGYNQFYPIRGVTATFSDTADSSAGITVLQFNDLQVIGGMTIGTNGIVAMPYGLPSTMDLGIAVTYPDGSQQMVDADGNCIDCPPQVATVPPYPQPTPGPDVPQPAATSFLGRAWNWITGRAFTPPREQCTSTGTFYRGRQYLVTRGERFSRREVTFTLTGTPPGTPPPPITEHTVTLPDGTQNRVLIQPITLEPPIIRAGDPTTGTPPTYGRAEIVYAVSVQDSSSTTSHDASLVNLYLRTTTGDPIPPEQLNSRLASAAAYYRGGGIQLSQDITTLTNNLEIARRTAIPGVSLQDQQAYVTRLTSDLAAKTSQLSAIPLPAGITVTDSFTANVANIPSTTVSAAQFIANERESNCCIGRCYGDATCVRNCINAHQCR